MALFSEIDWIVIAGVAALLFFGPQGQHFVRQMGRWYARMLQFKTEIMSEVTASTGLPVGPGATTGSIRSALLAAEFPAESAASPMTTPTLPGIITQVQPVGVWAVETQTLGAGMGPGTWWVATTTAPGEVVRLR
ncbi:MAG TPA: hypothetical protein VGG32_01890 [Thermoplasmata archaeon]|jgi:hypothetical protein